MVAFRVVDPHGKVVATRHLDSAEGAHAWFADSIDSTELGWRIEVNDDGQWAHFDDTGGIRLHPGPR
jgi:hypothetical protein